MSGRSHPPSLVRHAERLIRDEPLQGRERDVFVEHATTVFEALISNKSSATPGP